MKEKLEIRKNEKKASFKNSFVDEILSVKKESAVFRIFENETLSISYFTEDIEDDKAYECAYKNHKYPYSHTTKLNTQLNVIAKRSNMKEKDMAEITEKIGSELSKLFENPELKYSNVNYRYNLSNQKKLHMNFEDERNIFELNLSGENFLFNYRTVDYLKVLEDIKRYISPLIDNKYIEIENICGKNIIVPSDLNIYDFFEYFLSCENVVSNDLFNKNIFSQKLSLYTSLSPDDTKSEKYGVLPFFDWEGSYNPYYRNVLIDGGMLIKPYSNKDLSKKYEIENTCCSYALKDNYPSCKLLGAYIQSGDYNLDEMVKSAILLDKADISVDNENIKFDVKRAYFYENGKLTSLIKPFSFIVNAFRLFGNKFLGASKDMLFNSDLRRALVFSDI